MYPSRRHNRHTVVLASRGKAQERPLVVGSKQEHVERSRESSAALYLRSTSYKPRPSPQPTPRSSALLQHASPVSDSLLVRFGVDNTLGRAAARMLIWMFVLQPVYVAFGMEVDNELVIESTETVEEVDTSGGQDGGAEHADPAGSDGEAEQKDDAAGSTEEVVEDTTSNENAMSDVNTALPEEPFEEDTEPDDEKQENGTRASSSDTTSEIGSGATAGTGEYEGEGSTRESEPVEGDETGVSEDISTSTPHVPEQGSGGGSNPGDESDDEGMSETGTRSPETVATSTDDVADGESDDAVGDHDNDSEEIAGNNDGTVSSTTPDVPRHTQQDSEASSGSGDSETGSASSTNAVATTTATSSDVLGERAVEFTTNPANKYVFGERDCTLVADGEFYCITPGPKRLSAEDSRAYVQQDRDGDKEIFFFDGVESVRITNNGYDDFAPVYDEEQRTIVWQANINDRMQIMMYHVPTHTVRQVTNARENSSNPDIMGNMIVWQQWVDTNWEIMMTTVPSGGAPFDIERLTDNAVHDMFPQVYDGLVTWQSERGSTWEVVVYDIKTGTKRALEKNENTKYENPRFVLLFDSKHDNGDVETVGYDIETGKMIELGTRSTPKPQAPLSPKEKLPDVPVQQASSTAATKLNTKEGDDGSASSTDVTV